jgi:protein-L-isoaspartate(D-aspartate) O-methyltransferase
MEMIFERRKQQMIERLRKKGITDETVLSAMYKINRHNFVASGLEIQAYDETSLPIGFGQTISHPYTVAVMTQALKIKKGERVLEIGTGSGYQAAVLCELGATVFTIEKIANLAKISKQRLEKEGYYFQIRVGDGTLGWQIYAPFDAIIVTAGAPAAPENMLDQLSDTGRLIIPVGDKDAQILTFYLKDHNNSLKKIEIETLNFVPLLGRKGWQQDER